MRLVLVLANTSAVPTGTGSDLGSGAGSATTVGVASLVAWVLLKRRRGLLLAIFVGQLNPSDFDAGSNVLGPSPLRVVGNVVLGPSPLRVVESLKCCSDKVYLFRVFEGSALGCAQALPFPLSLSEAWRLDASLLRTGELPSVEQSSTVVAPDAGGLESAVYDPDIQIPGTTSPLCNARGPKGTSFSGGTSIPDWCSSVRRARFSSSSSS